MDGAPLLALLVSLAPQAPTVGDTVWLERVIPLPVGVTVRPRPIPSSPLLDPLASPRVILRDRSAVIQYPVVVWRPGRHAIPIPGPILVRPDGWSDSLPSAVAAIEIGSVLPDVPADSLPPHPAAAPIRRGERSPLPILLMLLVAAAGLVPVHLWWRRRGPGVEARPPPRPAMTPEVLDRWLSFGETRAALEGWSALIRERPGDGGRERILARLEDARYGAKGGEDLPVLVEEARAWLESEDPRAGANGAGR